MQKPRKHATTPAHSGEAPGFAVRRVAADMLDGVLRGHRARSATARWCAF